jgi:hypothetical protein
MNRNLASALALAGTAAAAFAFGVLSPVTASADEITIDTTPFVSTKTRAEVAAEVAGQGEALRMASSEAAMQAAPLAASDYTAEQAKADYIAARDEVNALTREDSGSFYLTQSTQPAADADVILAGSPE